MKLHIYNSHELSFVELNISGTNSYFEKCDPESKYLDRVVFNMFTECFKKVNKQYEYFGGTKYNSRLLILLRNQLLANLTILENTRYLSDFQKYIGSRQFGKELLISLIKLDKNWTGRWPIYLEKLRQINKEILDTVDLCINEGKILWIIGY